MFDDVVYVVEYNFKYVDAYHPNKSPKSASYYSLGISSTFLGYYFFLGSSFFLGSYFLAAYFLSFLAAGAGAELPNRICPSAMS
jgi:hypothetical protein